MNSTRRQIMQWAVGIVAGSVLSRLAMAMPADEINFVESSSEYLDSDLELSPVWLFGGPMDGEMAMVNPGVNAITFLILPKWGNGNPFLCNKGFDLVKYTLHTSMYPVGNARLIGIYEDEKEYVVDNQPRGGRSAYT